MPVADPANLEGHAESPNLPEVRIGFALMLLPLVVVVGLAKTLWPTIEKADELPGAPSVVVAIFTAMLLLLLLLLLLSEAWTAMRAAQANRFQTS